MLSPFDLELREFFDLKYFLSTLMLYLFFLLIYFCCARGLWLFSPLTRDQMQALRRTEFLPLDHKEIPSV